MTSNGSLILASRPWAKENNPDLEFESSVCPAQSYIRDENNQKIHSFHEGSYGAILKYNPYAATPEERFTDLTSRFGAEICPNGIMTLDADNNIYFVSGLGTSPAHRIYQVAADGQSAPVLLHTFVATASSNLVKASQEGFGPSVLKAGSEPGTLYGINYLGGTNNQGTLFRIQLDADQQPVYKVLRHAKAAEDGVMGTDTTGILPLDQQGLLEYDNRLYYTTQAGAGHFGTISSIDLTEADTHSSWQAHKTFTDTMGMGMLVMPTQEGRPISNLVLGQDNQVYGLLGSAMGAKKLYRFDPANDSFTSLEDLARVPSFITGGLNGKIYWLEEIIQGAESGKTFLMEYDPGFDGPFITAFYTPTPEQNWSSSLTTNLIWQTEGATSCTASGDWEGNKGVSNTTGENIALDTSKTSNIFTLTCTNGASTVSRTLPVSIQGQTPAPVITDFRSDAYNLTAGNSTSFTLSWTTEDAASCAITRNGTNIHNIASADTTSGSHAIPANVAGTSAYGLTCTGAGGETTAWTPALSITVTNPATKSSSGGSSLTLFALLPFGLLALVRSYRRNRVIQTIH